MTPADSIGHLGHGEHAGPIFPETDADGNWGDIMRRSTTATVTIPGNFEAEVPGGSKASNGRVLSAVVELMQSKATVAALAQRRRPTLR